MQESMGECRRVQVSAGTVGKCKGYQKAIGNCKNQDFISQGESRRITITGHNNERSVTHSPLCILSWSIFVYNNHRYTVVSVEVRLLSYLKAFKRREHHSNKSVIRVIEKDIKGDWQSLATSSACRN